MSKASENVVGEYIVSEEIGKGSFATVYKGHHRLTGEPVAIKTVSLSLLSPKLLSNLDSEITILRTLSHPHIVVLIDCIKTPHYIHLVMEYCSMGDLSQYIKANGKGLEPGMVKGLLAQLTSALRFLRDRDLIHRDVKPQNLLLAPSGSDCPLLKLADFGFARSLPSTSLAETLCGSPLYMAPEILRYEKYDAKADLWSVGTVVYEMSAGKPPFRANNHVELLRRIEKVADRVVFPDTVPAEMRSMLLGLLKRKPSDRISFDDFFAAADELCGQEPDGIVNDKNVPKSPATTLTVRRPSPQHNQSSAKIAVQRRSSRNSPSPSSSIMLQRRSPPDADEYIIVEKRTVEVNALADDLKQSPHRPSSMTRLSLNRAPSFGYSTSPTSALARALGMASIRLFGEQQEVSADSGILIVVETCIRRAAAVYDFAMVKFAQLPFKEDHEEETNLAVVRTIAEEAMVLLCKSLASLTKGLESVHRWWDGKVASSRLNDTVQVARTKFNDTLAKAEYVRAFLDDEPITITAEKLLYERALEIARGAACKELVNDNLDGCIREYEIAYLMLEAVAEDCEGEDGKLVSGWIASVTARIKQVRKKMLV